MVQVHWQGGMKFEGVGDTGGRLTMDAYPDEPGTAIHPTPLETLLMSAAACSAMDVVSILNKMRQNVTSYRVEVTGERIPPGTYPRPYTAITIRHILEGDDLDPKAVEKAVVLSDEKYCSVVATFRAEPKVVSEWAIVQPA